jgi:hypothetical protein
LGQYYRSPDIRGARIFSIESPDFRVSYEVYLDRPKPGMMECWKALPGAFSMWFLLCQSADGMKWEDLQLAQQIIAPGHRLSPYLLRKYETEGLLLQRGIRWTIAESRAVILSETGSCRLQYCGDPSLLWGLYRRMSHTTCKALPMIDVISNRGGLPYLEMEWDQNLTQPLERYLRNKSVQLRSTLWNH